MLQSLARARSHATRCCDPATRQPATEAQSPDSSLGASFARAESFAPLILGAEAAKCCKLCGARRLRQRARACCSSDPRLVSAPIRQPASQPDTSLAANRCSCQTANRAAVSMRAPGCSGRARGSAQQTQRSPGSANGGRCEC